MKYNKMFTSTEVSCKTRHTGIVEVADVVYKKVRVTPTQYIHRFMRHIKDILRGVYDLHDVRIYIKAFDPLNEIHEWIVTVAEILNLKINYGKSIFLVIFEKHILFLGTIQF